MWYVVRVSYYTFKTAAYVYIYSERINWYDIQYYFEGIFHKLVLVYFINHLYMRIFLEYIVWLGLQKNFIQSQEASPQNFSLVTTYICG